MKKLNILIFFIFLLIVPGGQPRAEILDSCAAIVNEDVILLSEVEEAGKVVFQQIRENAPSNQRDKALKQARKGVIEELIKKKLLIQQAAQMHISVTEAEIDQALERVLGRSRMGIEGFQAELRKMGMTERQYREMLKEQVLVSKLMNYTVRSKVVVLEDEIKAYYEQQDTKNSGGYYLLQIGFSPTGGGLPTDPEEAKRAVLQKADKVHALAEKGSDFKELARRYSDLPSAIDGGDIGIFQKDEMASYMREAVTSLQPGAVSPVIEVPEGGYMIFKLLSIGRISYESVREEIQDILYKQEMQERYNTWIDEIRNTAYIKIIE